MDGALAGLLCSFIVLGVGPIFSYTIVFELLLDQASELMDSQEDSLSGIVPRLLADLLDLPQGRYVLAELIS